MKNQSLEGLKESKVLELREKFGENLLPEKSETSRLSILLAQFKSPFIYILIFADLVSLIFKEYVDAGLISSVVFLNAIMGFYQEYNVHKTLTALKKILKHETVVIREGKRKTIESKDLVPGDLVFLTAGDKVPADGRLIDGTNLLVHEAILTGEEEAIEKKPQKSSLFMGTTVIWGKGMMEVTKTGSKTEIGKIGQTLLETKKEKTPLQIRLEKVARNLTYVVIIVCIFVFLTGLIYQKDVLLMFELSIILAVAVIPEGLPIAITVILSLGMRRILKRKGLVKQLLSLETLGVTSVICTDKTGTLTQGLMQLTKTDFKDSKKMLLAITFNNRQKTHLEVCLWKFLKKQKSFNPESVLKSGRIIYEEPFDSGKKYSLAINEVKGKATSFILGAPEIILSFCSLPKEEKDKISAQIENWANQGLKIAAAAFKEKGDLKERKNYQWLGLLGIEDPTRPEVKEVIKECQQAGISVKIVTGDYRKTAERLALSIGFDLKPGSIMEGVELEKISDKELKKKINNILLFTRVTPHQKLKIVKALQENGEVVAMTGDGVNDALALKKADIGVAVENASDVAKESSDLILLDSNFKTIVAACEEGRLILSNIKKVISYVLSNSFAEIVLILGAIVMDFPAPLTVAQILWIHLICDGPPDIMLGFEPKEKDLMNFKPKKIGKEGLLGRLTILLILTISLSTGLIALFLFSESLKGFQDLNLARTLAFATLAAADLIYIFAFKNFNKLIVKTENFFQNKYLLLGVVYGFVLLFTAVYVPQLNKALGTVPLKPIHWCLVFGVGLFVTLLVEVIKVFRGRLANNNS